jgi:hypothetical protein
MQGRAWRWEVGFQTEEEVEKAESGRVSRKEGEVFSFQFSGRGEKKGK